MNESLCKEVRQTALQGLVPFHPVEEAELEKSAGIALDSWFSHPGDYQTVSRSADIGKKLAGITFIEVHLPDDSKTVTCKARITELQPSYKVRQR